MSLESAIQELTAAVKENTAAHLQLADVAKAASTGAKPSETKKEAQTPAKDETDEDEAEAQKKAAAAERRKKAAEKKKAEAEAAAAAEAEAEAEAEGDDDLLGGDDDLPEVQAEASVAEIKKAAGAFLDEDDENFRDDNKAKVISAFKHLGVSKLGGLTDAEDRAKLLAYIAYWNAGLEVNFEDVDERVIEAA